jgi:tetratricopeptide (TPR) repeat protein
LGQFAQAADYFAEAIDIQEAIQNRTGQGYSLTHLGLTLIQLERYAAAEDALQQAVRIRQDAGADALAIDSLSGLALIQSLNGEHEQAAAQVREIVAWMAANGTDGIELPVLVYLLGYRVLETAVAHHAATSAEAQSVLDAGYALLQERAHRIQDSTLRRQFLENVPYHWELVAARQSDHA